MELLDKDPDEFIKKLAIRWNLHRSLSEIKIQNSGIQEFQNLNLSEIESQIDELIGRAAEFYKNNKDKQPLITRIQKWKYNEYSEDLYKLNVCNLSPEEHHDFCINYYRNFKKPVQELLFNYLRIKFNPELKFSGELLQSLNFRPCSFCCK
jgi:hypothetical protein